MEEKLVEFLRERDYVLVRELGQGACGKTVLLRDDTLEEFFVCKKYAPHSEAHREDLFANFVREIKLLHLVYDPHVVRVFNYYIYPERLAGYILMEYVNGDDIEEYIRKAPEKTNEIFLQTIEGFRYLEMNNILHRDIRPQNVMVRDDGIVKIIDLGFGKHVEYSEDFDKSISLNWWCEPPREFANGVYDFRTEVYFVGKLFEKMILDVEIRHFKYDEILRRMCQREPESRIQSFQDIEREIQNNLFFEIEFTEQETSFYRDFAMFMEEHLKKIANGAKYVDDIDRVETRLEDSYRSFMLEEFAPDAANIIRLFIEGEYYYAKRGFPVYVVKNFLHLLKSSTQEKKRIILANLHTRLDSIPRYPQPDSPDDVPF